jgi:NADH-quinone oxidoreductase subunit A
VVVAFSSFSNFSGEKIGKIMSEENLWSLLHYGLLILGLILVMLTLSYVLGERRKPGKALGEPYESGILPTHVADIRVPIQFYLIAMFFVIFDLEAVYIFAWAVAVREAGWLGFWAMLIFIVILFVALAYEWGIGALDWGPQSKSIQARRRSSQESGTNHLINPH